MALDGLRQYPHNTTLMGVVNGVAGFFGLQVSEAMLYGGSGHAFLINIHRDLCPSGPYVWDRTRFYSRLENLGIRMAELGFFGIDTGSESRSRIERRIIEFLDAGVPCSLLNMEHQVIVGHDATGFITPRPWECNKDFPPDHLTFGTWQELGDNVHLSFHRFERVEPADELTTAREGLRSMAEQFNRQAEPEDPYAMGAEAWQRWANAVRAGHGAEHGNWWNATVWSECRGMGGAFVRETAQRWPAVAQPAGELARLFDETAADLEMISNREMDPAEKARAIERAAARETECASRATALAGALA